MQVDRRVNVMRELMRTEKQYIADMNMTIKLFLEPIKEKNLLGKNEIGMVFSNLPALVPVNQVLFEGLEKDQDKVGAVFLENITALKPYSIYCSSQHRVVHRLHEFQANNTELQNFLMATSINPLCRGMLLPDFLIMPLQRMCKYPLLLNSLLQCTPTDHPDYEALNEALMKMRQLIDMINDRTGIVENIRKLKDLEDSIENSKNYGLIQSHRAILRTGTALLRRITRTQVNLYLLTDMLLITRPKDPRNEKSMCVLVHRLMLFTPPDPNEAVRADQPSNGGIFFFIGDKEGCVCQLFFSNSDKTIEFLEFPSLAEKLSWMEDVQRATESWHQKWLDQHRKSLKIQHRSSINVVPTELQAHHNAAVNMSSNSWQTVKVTSPKAVDRVRTISEQNVLSNVRSPRTSDASLKPVNPKQNTTTDSTTQANTTTQDDASYHADQEAVNAVLKHRRRSRRDSTRTVQGAISGDISSPPPEGVSESVTTSNYGSDGGVRERTVSDKESDNDGKPSYSAKADLPPNNSPRPEQDKNLPDKNSSSPLVDQIKFLSTQLSDERKLKSLFKNKFHEMQKMYYTALGKVNELQNEIDGLMRHKKAQADEIDALKKEVTFLRREKRRTFLNTSTEFSSTREISDSSSLENSLKNSADLSGRRDEVVGIGDGVILDPQARVSDHNAILNNNYATSSTHKTVRYSTTNSTVVLDEIDLDNDLSDSEINKPGLVGGFGPSRRHSIARLQSFELSSDDDLTHNNNYFEIPLSDDVNSSGEINLRESNNDVNVEVNSTSNNLKTVDLDDELEN